MTATGTANTAAGGGFDNSPKPCPSCGHCPTCGRGRQPYQNYPYYPWNQWIWCNTTSNNDNKLAVNSVSCSC